ncbi:MAG: hypothetical protein ABSC26_04540 [Stellaceae bacterium]|jgi:hypothetical protein
MRHLVIFVCAVFLVVSPVLAESPGLVLFPTEQQAQQHCPRDMVVWLNTPSGIYHYQGQRWYGTTKHGAFVCKREADAAGDRGSLNGQ